MVELTTQLLILESVLWIPLCRINKFGLNTLPSKTAAIPYTCGLSGTGTLSLVGGANLHVESNIAKTTPRTPNHARPSQQEVLLQAIPSRQ